MDFTNTEKLRFSAVCLLRYLI